MNLRYVRKLLRAADPFSAIRTSFRGWRKQPERHLTLEEVGDISSGLQDSITGPVSMSAAKPDKEAVCYEGEIANVLEDAGFNVEIDNSTKEMLEQQTPAGLEMTIKEATVRPVHANRIARAFRHAGIAIATRINAMRRNNDTLYITVGPNDASGVVPAIRTTATRRSNLRAALFKKRKLRFS